MQAPAKTPQCVGIILDGNRRWARERGLPTLEGHRQGAERLRECVQWVRARGIQNLVVYAFSSENWERTEDEVSYMMDLVVEYAGKVLDKVRSDEKDTVNIVFVGDRARAPKKVQDAITRVESANCANPSFTLWVCFSYGGKVEIVTAAEKLRHTGTEITTDSLRAAMWTADMPDPDIIIRTGGEKRLSGFLLWQSEYSELFFIDRYWPDFSEKILDDVLAEFAERERRHGK